MPIATSAGKSSLGMKFFRRSSSGSMPSSAATWSTIISIRWVASGRPAPRIASVANLFVKTPDDVGLDRAGSCSSRSSRRPLNDGMNGVSSVW